MTSAIASNNRRQTRLGFGIILCGAALAVPRVGLAQGSPNAAPAGSEQGVDDLFAKGKAAGAKGDFSKAYALFKEAWGKKQAYDIAGNLGQAALALNKNAEAAQYLSYCVRNHPPSGDAVKLARTKDFLKRAQSRIVTVRLNVTPSDARLSVDGIQQGTTSVLGGETYVEPGTHTISAELEGYTPASQEVSGAKGESRSVDLSLTRTAPEPIPVASGISSSPVSPTVPPTEDEPLPTGRSEVPTIVGASIFAVGLVAGVGFRMAASSKQDDADRLSRELPGSSPCSGVSSGSCADLQEANRSVERNKNLSTASFVVAGAAGVGTLAYYFFWPEHAERAAVRPNATATANGANVWLSGQF